MTIALFLDIFIILIKLVENVGENQWKQIWFPLHTYNNDQQWMNKIKLIHTFWAFFIAFLLVQIYHVCLSIICVILYNVYINNSNLSQKINFVTGFQITNLNISKSLINLCRVFYANSANFNIFHHISAVGLPNRLIWITKTVLPISSHVTDYWSHMVF